MTNNVVNKDFWWNKLKKDILNTGLFSNSGTEIGVSSGSLRLEENNGHYSIKRVPGREVPEVVYAANPDRFVDYPALNKFTFGKIPTNWLIGNYKKIYIGYHKNSSIRRSASSGGIISGIQAYMLQTRKASKAITLRMRSDKPYLAEPILAKSLHDILSSAQSKYTIAPINQILSKVPTKDKSIVYTGLPHDIVAIRKLQMLRHSSVKPISLILGLFYGETLDFSAIKSVLNAYKYGGVGDITKLSFREGEWPGNLKIDFRNGKEISIRKLYANYLIPSHITEYSLYQIDYTSELADISVGDAWSPKYEERGKGWSVVISRSNKGEAILREMLRKKIISLQEINAKELIEMHSHGLDLKKRGAFIRISRARKKGLPVPEYGYSPINLPFKRKVFEFFLGGIFKLFRSAFFIQFIERVPIKITGSLFVIARNLWKKFTKSSKKGGLATTKFKLDYDVYNNSFSYIDVRRFWDKVSPIYETANSKVGYVHFQRFEKAFEYGKFKSGERVLNIWSRTGRFIPYLKKVGGIKLDNLEISQKMIDIAKKNFPKENFRLTDLENLNSKNDYYDKIVSLETLEHTPKPLKFLQELHRVLKKDGILIMSLPPKWFEIPTRIYDYFFQNHGEGPHRFLNPDVVYNLLSAANFEVTHHSVHFIIPLGNEFLTRKSGEILNKIFSNTPLANFAVRHFYVAKKKN